MGNEDRGNFALYILQISALVICQFASTLSNIELSTARSY